MTPTPDTSTHIGRHRPTIVRCGLVGLALRQIESERRDREAILFGYDYTPRHSAAHRAEVAAA